MTDDNLETQIAKLLGADPICGGRVGQETVEAIAALCHDRFAVAGKVMPGDAVERVEKARRICAEARSDYAEGFLSGEYDNSSTEMRAVLIALSNKDDEVTALRVAKALHGYEESWNDHTWEQLPKNTRDMFIQQAFVAVGAMRGAAT